jgi:predicted TIM-barrel fold metal-dependent hydrolase
MWGTALEEAMRALAGYEDFIHTFGSIDLERLEDVDFAAHVDETFSKYKAMGIRGLKFWKNLGLGIKDSTGRYIPVDDDRLRPVWESAAKYSLIVLIHVADPKAFFTPVDRKNEYYEMLCNQPSWSFYGDAFYTFEQLMQQQENLIANSPETTFVIPHMGSCAEDLAFVGGLLDKYPNMHIDTSARINELGRQPYTARAFFIKYADRILFGTDFTGGAIEDIYPYYFRFFETYDEYFPCQPLDDSYDMGRWRLYGLGLPDDVLKKLYSANAKNLLKF